METPRPIESPAATPVAYAAPRDVPGIEQCWFYHRMELPGAGVVGGQWDLRGQVDDYLGRFDFRDKRVLDVGTASGFLTFEMEKRGAAVVSFDMLDNRGFNLLPFASQQQGRDERVAQMAGVIDRMKNSYWFAHRALNSRAQVYYGDVHDLPQALGQFDVVLLAQILVHLRDPLGAILSASRLSSDAVILTEGTLEDARPIGSFIPRVTQGPDHS
jgi:SAM-dependent methyltransferase